MRNEDTPRLINTPDQLISTITSLSSIDPEATQLPVTVYASISTSANDTITSDFSSLVFLVSFTDSLVRALTLHYQLLFAPGSEIIISYEIIYKHHCRLIVVLEWCI